MKGWVPLYLGLTTEGKRALAELRMVPMEY